MSGVNFWRETAVMYGRFFKASQPLFDYFWDSYESMIHNCSFSPEMRFIPYLNTNIPLSRAMTLSKDMQSGHIGES